MWLDENAVDLLEIDNAGLITHRFQEAADAQVAGAAQETFPRADDERQGFGREGVVTQASTVQLGDDEGLNRFGKGSTHSLWCCSE